VDSINFAAIRYLLLPEQQNVFYQPLNGKQKQELFINSFFNNTTRHFRTKRDVEGAIIVIDRDDGVYYGKFARKKLDKRFIMTDTDILEEKLDNWPFLIFSCDTNPNEQLFVIECKTGYYFSLNTVCQIIKDITYESISMVGYQLDLKIIPEKGAFWELIDKSQKIYSVKFSIDSPNLFGSTFKANELAGEVADLFHTTKTNFELENERGDVAPVLTMRQLLLYFGGNKM
jgi:hypothetical protein